MTGPGAPVASLRAVTVVEAGSTILRVDALDVPSGGVTALLGPNGAGKSSLLRLVGGHRHATTGTVDVLGHRVGRVELRALRQHVGIVSETVVGLLDRGIPVRHLVAGALHGLTAPRPAQLDGASLERADEALTTVAMQGLADRRGASLSAGEWQRVLLARALVADPVLLLLDEPFVGLDLAQRAHLLAHLDALLAARPALTAIIATHHLEELPRATSSVVLLADGGLVAAGPIGTTLTSATVSTTYGLPVEVVEHGGTWRATAST